MESVNKIDGGRRETEVEEEVKKKRGCGKEERQYRWLVKIIVSNEQQMYPKGIGEKFGAMSHFPQ